MKKKLLTVLLASVLSASLLCGCGDKEIENGSRQRDINVEKPKDAGDVIVDNNEGNGDINNQNGDIDNQNGDIDNQNGDIDDSSVTPDISNVKSLEDLMAYDYFVQQMDETVEQLRSQNSSVFSDIQYSIFDNTLEYDYYFVNAVEPMGDIVVDSATKSQLDMGISQMKTGSGITDPITIIYEYYNPDGSEAGRLEYTK